jgi:prophage antirepressor-like protein
MRAPEKQTATRSARTIVAVSGIQPALPGADQCHEVNIMNSSDITPFLFEGECLVRVIIRDGAPWFVAADVCKVLGLTNPSKAVDGLDADEVAAHTLTNSEGTSGNPNVNIISESGLYALIFRSRKPAAVRFRKWVTQDVLPALRKTGGYKIDEKESKARLADRRVKMNERNAATRSVMAANQALQLIGRAGGPRAIAKNAPAFYGKLGIDVDMLSAFDQGDFFDPDGSEGGSAQNEGGCQDEAVPANAPKNGAVDDSQSEE